MGRWHFQLENNHLVHLSRYTRFSLSCTVNFPRHRPYHVALERFWTSSTYLSPACVCSPTWQLWTQGPPQASSRKICVISWIRDMPRTWLYPSRSVTWPSLSPVCSCWMILPPSINRLQRPGPSPSSCRRWLSSPDLSISISRAQLSSGSLLGSVFIRY